MSIASKRKPRVWHLTVEPYSTFGENRLHLEQAVFLQIQNYSNTPLLVRLNDDELATFIIEAQTTQVFNEGDLTLTSVDFANMESGAEPQDIQVIAGILQV